MANLNCAMAAASASDAGFFMGRTSFVSVLPSITHRRTAWNSGSVWLTENPSGSENSAAKTCRLPAALKKRTRCLPPKRFAEIGGVTRQGEQPADEPGRRDLQIPQHPQPDSFMLQK